MQEISPRLNLSSKAVECHLKGFVPTGLATYIGCGTSAAVRKFGLWGPNQQAYFPLITRSGTHE